MGIFKKDPDPFAASRYEGMFRSVRTRERKHMRHWWQWVALGLAVLLLGFGGLLWIKLKGAEGRMHESGPGELPVAQEGKPFNVLLVGSDSREGLTLVEQHTLGANAVGGQRSDTLILAQIDPTTNEIVMAQFPRDLYVDILDEGTARINTALEAGPRHLVKTVEDLTGLTIHRYVQVNIAGFRDLVDAIGGVDICITEPIPFDPATGIEVKAEEVGMVHFNGDRAIRFVRSRRFPTGDFQRIQNQQKFLAAAINKVLSVGTFLRPGRILKLIDVAGDNLATDANTTLNGLRRLAGRFRSFDPEHYEAYVVPNMGSATIDGASVVAPDPEAMDLMFEALARHESPAEYDGVPDIDPTTVRVGVYNGIYQRDATEGIASGAADALVEATDTGEGGVQVAEIANARKGNYKETTIRYAPEAEKMAQLIAAAIPDAVLEEVEQTQEGTDVEVIVAKDFEAQRVIQLLPIPIPPPTEPPPECR